MAVQAMKAGAIDFLTKPFREQELLDDIREAFRRDRAISEHRRHLAGLRKDYELLTPCERVVMERVVTGRLNKQTAAELGITEKTVKFHRGHVMRKMQAGSVADLVLKAEQLCLLARPVSGDGAGGDRDGHPAIATSGQPVI
jgi:FixJ family two-component response regulator